MAQIRSLLFISLACVTSTFFAVLSVPFIDSAGAVSYLAVIFNELLGFDATAALLLVGLASVVALARPSPAAFRSFWQRLTARVDYTVSSTT